MEELRSVVLKSISCFHCGQAGPYMCGEWEFGGLPAWLYENGTVPIRTDAEPYISAAQHYWETQLLPQVPLMVTRE